MIIGLNSERVGAAFGRSVQGCPVHVEYNVIRRDRDERTRGKREIDVLETETVHAGIDKICRERSHFSAGASSPSSRPIRGAFPRPYPRPKHYEKQTTAEALPSHMSPCRALSGWKFLSRIVHAPHTFLPQINT